MESKPTTPTNPHIYAYTQHIQTIRLIEQLCRADIKLLTQDRNKDPVEDVLSQIPEHSAVLYAVLPIDKAVELRQRAPGIRLLILQLDAKLVEQLTGQPYNPKAEYQFEVIRKALKVFEVKGGEVKTMNFEELQNTLRGKTVAVFNDTVRQALQSLIPDANFTKTCSGGCIEINPPGNKPGIRISFPGTLGQLTAEQMAELIRNNKARIYYAEIEAVEVPPCP
jgi:hypothetical protein